jgi:hypothetical protein
VNWRNGYRERHLDTRVHFPSPSSAKAVTDESQVLGPPAFQSVMSRT